MHHTEAGACQKHQVSQEMVQVHRESLLAAQSDSDMGRQDHQRRMEGSHSAGTGRVVENSDVVVDGADDLAGCCLDAVTDAAVPNENCASVVRLRNMVLRVFGFWCLRRKATENIHTVLRSRELIMIYIRKFCIIDRGEESWWYSHR